LQPLVQAILGITAHEYPCKTLTLRPLPDLRQSRALQPEKSIPPVLLGERCKLIDLGEWAKEGYRIPLAEEETNKGENLN